MAANGKPPRADTAEAFAAFLAGEGEHGADVAAGTGPGEPVGSENETPAGDGLNGVTDDLAGLDGLDGLEGDGLLSGLLDGASEGDIQALSEHFDRLGEALDQIGGKSDQLQSRAESLLADLRLEREGSAERNEAPEEGAGEPTS